MNELTHLAVNTSLANAARPSQSADSIYSLTYSLTLIRPNSLLPLPKLLIHLIAIHGLFQSELPLDPGRAANNLSNHGMSSSSVAPASVIILICSRMAR